MQLTALQQSAAQAVVNIFETGSIRGNYSDVTLLPGDSGQLTYGRSQTTLASGTTIVVRVERTRSTAEISSLRASSVNLLQSVSAADHAAEGMMVHQRYQIKQALRPVDASEATIAEPPFVTLQKSGFSAFGTSESLLL